MTVWQGGVGAREKPGQGTAWLPGLSCVPKIPVPWICMMSFPKEHRPFLLPNCLLAHTFP